jgi:hypothetical protein
MLNFPPGLAIFAVAGVVAAAGPVIIHLLNRRRFRTINWAAMEFLLEAMQRNRRVLQLRDLILLLLRVLCILLFGLALARPFFQGGSGGAWQVFFASITAALVCGAVGAALWANRALRYGACALMTALLVTALFAFGKQFGNGPDDAQVVDAGQAVHAVLLVDNSLSMGYQRELTGILLDEAKEKAREFIGQLPVGSRISVIPLCGSPEGYSLDAYRSKEDAEDALEKIAVVDRSIHSAEAAALALEASATAPELTKRIILIGDQQAENWNSDSATAWKALPELQVVSVHAPSPENSWVADLLVQDAIADVESETTLTAVLRHEGDGPRNGVQVTLVVDGAVVGTKTVDLQPEQSLPVSFAYKFDVQVEPGSPAFVPCEVTLSADRLPMDDKRELVVPVVAALPVVFIDQLGSEEDVQKNRFGETYYLRRWLAPIISRAEKARQLIQVRQTTAGELRPEMLDDARLVVMAGVSNPAPVVEILREYVRQGGQLFIAAGGDFDPATWDRVAWLDGQGILPVPLAPEPVGSIPEEAGSDFHPFQIRTDGLTHSYFLLADASAEGMQDLYRSVAFFKAVRAKTDDETLAELKKKNTDRIADRLLYLTQSDENRARWSQQEEQGKLTAEERQAQTDDRLEREKLEPQWLKWEHPRQTSPYAARPADRAAAEKLAAEIAAAEQPRVLAAFDGNVPFIVERAVGRGRIVLATTGMSSQNLLTSWNNLAKKDAMIAMDRIFRSLLESTLPQRNYSSSQAVVLPVRGAERRGRFELQNPGVERPEELYVEAIGADDFGVTVRDVSARGIYRVTAYPPESASAETSASKLWEIPLAVNGPADESNLKVLDEEQLRTRLKDVDFRWVNRTDQISLQGAQVTGQNLWWWLALVVLLGLLAEMTILAWPAISQESATEATHS